MVENLNSQRILFFKFLQKIICILNYKIIYYFFVLLQLISNVLNTWKSTFKSNTTTEFFIPKTAMIPMILENSVVYNICLYKNHTYRNTCFVSFEIWKSGFWPKGFEQKSLLLSCIGVDRWDRFRYVRDTKSYIVSMWTTRKSNVLQNVVETMSVDERCDLKKITVALS